MADTKDNERPSDPAFLPLTGVTPATYKRSAVSLTDLLIKDGSGDTGLPALLGWVGMLPCLAGLVAVMPMWRDRHVAWA